jgi:hypothetical protein
MRQARRSTLKCAVHARAGAVGHAVFACRCNAAARRCGLAHAGVPLPRTTLVSDEEPRLTAVFSLRCWPAYLLAS